jgi:predicted Rossmann fold flavoprotein
MTAPSVPRLQCDVVVVGAGAAGMMAAIVAAERGRSVVLLEKSPQAGLKILISGGGRCNLTTTRSGQDLEDQYGKRRGRFLRHALRAFPPTALRAFIEAAGVPLREEDLEKLFPVSQQARDVVHALLARCRERRVDLRLGWPMLDVARDERGFRVATPHGEVAAASLVLATGGLSYPKTGTTGDGYRFARVLGHTITPTFPALAPLAVDAAWVRELQGIVVHEVAIASLDAAGQVVGTRQRPILFTHKGLSGPAPMDLAGDVEEAAGAGAVRFDFAPGVAAEELERQWLTAVPRAGTRSVDSVLPQHLPARLRTALVTLGDSATTLANWGKEARRRLLAVLKGLQVPVARSLGYAHAEVTRGGVALDEVDARTMQSKRVPGLYVIGELLDVDGPIGGFNFTAAFATGRLAGLHA